MNFYCTGHFKENFLEIIFILESTLTDIRYLLPRECYFHYQVVPFCYMLTITVQNYFEEEKKLTKQRAFSERVQMHHQMPLAVFGLQ